MPSETGRDPRSDGNRPGPGGQRGYPPPGTGPAPAGGYPPAPPPGGYPPAPAPGHPPAQSPGRAPAPGPGRATVPVPGRASVPGPGRASVPAPTGGRPRPAEDDGPDDRTDRTDRTDRVGPGHSRHGDGPSPQPRGDRDEAPEEAPDDEVEAVPVRRPLSLSVAGFAVLLGVGLVFGAQTAGPDHRLPFAIVVFGVQVLFVLAWTMAMRPPALLLVAGVSVAVAAAADAAAVLPEVAGLAPLGFVAAGGFVLGVLGQLVRRADRVRVTDSLGTTLLIMLGVVSFATLIVLTRIPAGTQSIFVCLTATAVALAVARLVDAFFPAPRLAPQVPRGAAGVVAGAMIGTLAAGIIGSYLLGFTPTSAAVVGLVTAATAVLADLAVGYAEAGRLMAGEPPTMWVARHMQGPLGGFALAAPVAYAMCVLFLT